MSSAMLKGYEQIASTSGRLQPVYHLHSRSKISQARFAIVRAPRKGHCTRIRSATTEGEDKLFCDDCRIMECALFIRLRLSTAPQETQTVQAV